MEIKSQLKQEFISCYSLCAGGSRKRRARRQRALLSTTQVRQRILNVCVLASFNLTFLKWRERRQLKNKKCYMKLRYQASVAHLLFLYAPLQCFNVVLYSHIDKSVLCFSLHHSRALSTNHLNRLGYINVTVHPCIRKIIIGSEWCTNHT